MFCTRCSEKISLTALFFLLAKPHPLQFQNSNFTGRWPPDCLFCAQIKPCFELAIICGQWSLSSSGGTNWASPGVLLSLAWGPLLCFEPSHQANEFFSKWTLPGSCLPSPLGVVGSLSLLKILQKITITKKEEATCVWGCQPWPPSAQVPWHAEQ